MIQSGSSIEKAYAIAGERYAEYGVDTAGVLEQLARIAISIHCWQGDDVGGFESDAGLEGAGIQTTGNYPGKATTAEQLRADFEKALSLIPGTHRINLHAIYAETGGKKVERDELEPRHFANWVAWARSLGIGIDFNPTFFAHPKAESGFTLASYDSSVRRFWVGHGIACRRIADNIGRELGSPCVNNIWIPDGYKDTPADRTTPRETLRKSLDEILSEKFDRSNIRDSVECKLFGIGSESYVVGSHEFYLGYAIRNGILLCLDMGHFHPTEQISDKVSAIFAFVDEILFHISRGVRWDSDHVVVLSDAVREIALEIVRGKYLDRTHIGLDYFDASINRVAAWIIGTRSMLKALLFALLEPWEMLRDFEVGRDFTSRLVFLEELKSLPFGPVWDYYCLQQDVPVGTDWLGEIREYEKKVLASR
ncbi:MAG: L-rhamnose isomerase [Fidelibacterota bacterium]|nr:MAG: L-rhamnose isomerase [Candidatus Neomarinimicrobiota bacterium]